MTTDEKIQELQAVTNNLLIQSGLSMAKQGAMLQMTLGIYKETLDSKKYQETALKFIALWEHYCLEMLLGLKNVVDDPELLERQRLEVLSNVEQMKVSFLS